MSVPTLFPRRGSPVLFGVFVGICTLADAQQVATKAGKRKANALEIGLE